MTSPSRFSRAAFLPFVAALAFGQHHGATGTEKPVALLSGLGAWRHPIATRNPEAQKFFDQGLTLLYGFNRYESLRSFRKASELDPQAAMTFWGMSMALGPYINMDGDADVKLKESCDAVQAGLRVASRSSIDRAWLEAAGTRCPDFSDPSKYIRVMRDLAARLPDDPDAQTLYAEALMIPVRWKWYGANGQPAPGVTDAERALEAVLRRFPDHPGANHFYIHAVESSLTPERAVPSAQRLMGIVPAAGHMVHMPGHIWLVLGDFNNTIAVNERGAEVDRRYFEQTGVAGGYYMYYLHNLQFIVYTRGIQGRAAETRKAVEQMSGVLKQIGGAMPEMADVIKSWLAFAKLRAGLWDDVLNGDPPKSEKGAIAMWHAARGLAFAGKGQAAEARKEQAEFERLRKSADPGSQWGTNKLGDVANLASAVFDAKLDSSPRSALPKWKRAVAAQDALVYDEPPDWYYPVRESLGAALLLSGDAAGAEAAFREGLRRSPRNGRMLFGLLESLKAQKKTDAIQWVQREFDAAWKGADIELHVKSL
jgi:tetratricopeptide (TPR) repeat protein